MAIVANLAGCIDRRLCACHLAHSAGRVGRKHTYQTYGRCDDSIFHIGKLHSNLPKNRCLDMVDIIRFGGNSIVYLDWQSLFRSALRSFPCHQRKCRHRVDKVEGMQGVDFS